MIHPIDLILLKKTFEHYSNDGGKGFLQKLHFSATKNGAPLSVDECADFVFQYIRRREGGKSTKHMASVKWTYALNIRNCLFGEKNSRLYELDSLVKFLVATATHDTKMYAKNPHFGWQPVYDYQYEGLPHDKLKLAQQFIGKEIKLNSGGCRKSRMSLEGNNVGHWLSIPPEYQQYNYKANGIDNCCV